MKKTLLFICGAVAWLSSWAQPVAPKMTTAGDTTWYYVRFKTGGNVLADQNTGLRTAALSLGTKAQQWYLLGSSTNSFRMVSRLGNRLIWNGSRYVTAGTGGAYLKLEQSSNASATNYWEIKRTAGTQSMNQFGGTNAGAQLGEWTPGDNNNPLEFVPIQAQLPTFSTTGNDTWYFLQFRNGGFTIADAGEGVNSTVQLAQPVAGQLWKLVGNQSSFYLQNKDGRYLTYQNSRLTTTSTEPTIRFNLIASTNTNYFPAWEIGIVGTSGTAFNQWGGAAAGNTIGLYNIGDGGNPIGFVKENEMSYADYRVEGVSSFAPVNPFTLWYKQPITLLSSPSGDPWREYALPLGNGQLGATFYGGVKKEQIQFNEKTLWTGRSTDKSASYGAYQNFGSVFIENLDSQTFDQTDAKSVKNYVRYLDLNTATGVVQFTNADGSVTYTREYIVSYPDNVIAMRLKATAAGKQSVRISMKPGVSATATYANGEGTFSGQLETVRYNARLKVVPTNGTMATDANGISVTGADEILVVLNGSTDFDMTSATYVNTSLDLQAKVQGFVNTAATKGFEQIQQGQQEAHKLFFDRASLSLEGAASNVDTKTLIDDYTKGLKGTADPKALFLEQLYYHYGRYLMIGSSRGVDQPSNLQGIWNNQAKPAWNSDIHSNINVQMNYWPAEANNLSELHEPFLNYISIMAKSPQWKAYAAAANQPYGWTCYTENNIFGGVGSFMHNYVIANAWYCTHLWQHYRYTLDKDYLKRVFPAMWTATQFWLGRLKLDTDGTYVCPNEYSPEHGPASQDGVAHAQQLVADLFANTKQAIEVLGSEANVPTDSITLLNDRYSKLDKGLAIETYTGTWGATRNGVSTGTPILREWKTSNYDAGQNGHRHLSHLMCLYPFSQVNKGDSYFDAAVNSLRLRGDESTGWSMGWKINLWARANDGDHAHKILEYALQHTTASTGGVFYNLFDVHPTYIFQIDGNFGACAGISEMLMQSQTDTIQFLPALPTVWKAGSMRGMKAVGNFNVDFSWKDSKMNQAVITSVKGQPLYVKCPGVDTAQVLINGVAATPTQVRAGVIKINAQQNDVVTINFTPEATTGIRSASVVEKPALSVNGRTITVKNATATTVTDLSGRRLLTTSASSFTLPIADGKAFLVSMQTAKGEKVTQKVLLP